MMAGMPWLGAGIGAGVGETIGAGTSDLGISIKADIDPRDMTLSQKVALAAAERSDLTADVRYLVQEDDLVSSWVSYTATHEADFAGVPASGRRVKFAEWDLFRVRDDEIVELTQYCDLFTIMSQIGALPTAAPA